MAQSVNKHIQLHIPCMIDQFYPEAGLSIVKLLRHFGYEIEYPEGQTCCGLPAHHYGYADDAKAAGEKLLGEFQGNKKAVTISAACNGMVKEQYADIFNNTLQHNNCKRTQKSFNNFITLLLDEPEPEKHFKNNTDVLWLNFCGEHLYRYEYLNEKLFSKIKGLRVLSLNPEESFCCGFGGWYHAFHPELAAKLTEEVINTMKQHDIKQLLVYEPGCMIFLRNQFKKLNAGFECVHLADFLANSLANE